MTAPRPYANAAILAATLVLAAAYGAVIGLGPVKPTTLAAGGLAVASLVALAVGAARYGLALGAIAVVGASANALPGPSVGGLFVPAAIATPLLLTYVGRRHAQRVPWWLWLSSGLLIATWIVAVARPLDDGSPPVATIREGIDFLILAAIIPAATMAFSVSTFRRRVVVGFAALAVWVSIVTVAAATGLLPPNGMFAHAYQTTQGEGLLRIYSIANEVPTIAAPFALAAALIASTRTLRMSGAVVFLAALAAALVELGRVKYAGFVVMSLVIIVACGQPKALLRGALLLAVIGGGVYVAGHAGPLQQPVAATVERASTIFATSAERRAYENNDTLAYRARYAEEIRAALTNSDWAVGMGFRPSPWFAFRPDANDMLRNSDLGWYNALNTTGLLGVFLTLFPVVAIGAVCLRSARRRGPDRFLIVGGLGVVAYILTVSQTLVVLYSVTGVVLAGVALGAALAVARQP